MTDDEARWGERLPPLPQSPPRPSPPRPSPRPPGPRGPGDTLPGIERWGDPPVDDPWDEPEPARRDLYDRTAWIERIFWRTVFLIMFVVGVLSFAFEWLTWIPAAALAVGGLAPGLFLMAREQIERNVEADRAALRPETRHDGTLPPLRRTVRSVDDAADGR